MNCDPGNGSRAGDDVELGRRRVLAEARELQLAHVLADFSPVVVSTLLCGLHGPGSDLDVACRVADPDAFEAVVRGAYGRRSGFSARASRGDGPGILFSFLGPSLPVEVFGEDRPVEDQPAVRHFRVWSRLAELGGPDFRQRVRDLRAGGMKPEPAIAQFLALPGDPFAAVDRLRDAPDSELRRTLTESVI